MCSKKIDDSSPELLNTNDVPEFHIEKINEEYVVYSADIFPNLRIRREFQKASDSLGENKEDVGQEQVHAAVSLLKNIEYRREVLHNMKKPERDLAQYGV